MAFKEWGAVCQALSQGRQSILLRKGGIAETGGVFRPEHSEFCLYPTEFHEQQQGGLKPDEGMRFQDAAASNRPPFGTIRLTHICQVTEVWFVDQLSTAMALDPLHIWSTETVEKRFFYRSPGLYVILVRVWSLPMSVDVPETPHYAGCKTWVELDAAVETDRATAVTTQIEHAHITQTCRELLSATKPGHG